MNPFPATPRALRNRRRGYAALMMTLSLTLLCGVLGFVTDIGWAYYRKQLAQSATEAAALAGSSYAKVNGAVCGQNGVICQSTPTNCSSLTGTTSLTTACQYATANGFTDGSHNQVVKVSSGAGSTSNGVTTDYWVQVDISESLPQLFSAVLGHSTMAVNSEAISATTSAAAAGSVYVLGSGPGTVTTDGTANVGTNTDVYVNSSDPAAVQLQGGDNISHTGGHCTHIVGGCQQNGHSTISPQPQCGGSAKTDPYCNMPTPSGDSGCGWWWWFNQSSTNFSSGDASQNVLNPGTYCGDINITGSASVTLNPGTYHCHGNININTTGTVTGSGVTLHVCNQNGQGQCNITHGNVTLTPPTSGTCKGVTLYQDSGNTNRCTLTAGSTQKITGVIYVPGATVSHCGGASASAPSQTLVCNKLYLTGGTQTSGTAVSPYTGTVSLCK